MAASRHGAPTGRLSLYRGGIFRCPAGVDVVLDDPYRLPSADASVDMVVSSPRLEHITNFSWLMFSRSGCACWRRA